MASWSLYLIRYANNYLYTGITTDVSRRLAEHQAGKGARALRGKGELKMVFNQAVGDRSQALRAEYRIKRLSKPQKERLVNGETALDELLASFQEDAAHPRLKGSE